jgi:hypothetical protein
MDINPLGKYAKVFGVPRTGTTFVETILALNFDFGVYLNHYGNKHHEPLTLQEMRGWIEERQWIKDKYLSVLDGVIHPFVVIKNPYSWEQSIKRFSNNPNLNMEVEYGNYNYKYREWKKLLENPHKPFGKGFIIRYEDVLVDAENIFTNIAEETGLKMKDRGLIATGEFIVPTKVNSSDEFTDKRRRFYLSKDFGLSDEMVEKITRLVDWELMEFYGYERKW